MAPQSALTLMFNKSERFAANGVQSKTRDADRVWLPAFEMRGGVDLMRCPSIVSTVEAFGASPAAAAPAAMRGRSYGVAGPAAIDVCGHRIGCGWVRDHRRRQDRDPNQDSDWLGVIAGDEAGSEAELAAEMAELFANDSPFRVVPVPGDSGLKNISRLLHDPHIDAGFISTDVLAGAKTQSAGNDLAERLQVVARFCPQEVHVLARADIESLADLPARRSISVRPAAARR